LNSLDLYSNIEQYLDFSEEISTLYNAYDEIVSEINPSNLLDIGCGQGDFLLQIQNKNIKTFGIDLSNEQIKVCKAKGLDAQAIDVANITNKYDCATAVFDVLNYMDKDNLIKFLQDTYNTLNKNGYFIFDINSLFGFEEVAQGTLNIDIDDKFIALDAYFEDEKLTTNITLFEKTSNNLYNKTQNAITQYYHDKDTLTALLNDIGFRVDKIIHFHLHSTDEADKYIFIAYKC